MEALVSLTGLAPIIVVGVAILLGTILMMAVVVRTIRGVATEVRAMRDGNGCADDAAPSMAKSQATQEAQAVAIGGLQRVQVEHGTALAGLRTDTTAILECMTRANGGPPVAAVMPLGAVMRDEETG